MEIQFNNEREHINYNLVKNANILFPEMSKDGRIFHYTSTAGLEGILSNKKLYFTNIRYMNDKNEILAGMECLAKKLNIPKDKFLELVHRRKNLGEQNFVCCFSYEQNSLPLWNYYCKDVNNRGFNIEFNARSLIESILKSNPCLEGCSIAYGDVDYCNENCSTYSDVYANKLTSLYMLDFINFCINSCTMSEEISKEIPSSRIEELNSAIENAQKSSVSDNLPVYFFDGSSCCFGKSINRDYMNFIKDSHFSQEREFRIIVSVPDSQLLRLKEQGAYKLRISNGIITPYLELSFSLNSVTCITISPMNKNELVTNSVYELLFYSGLKPDYSLIKNSKIPVRF